MYRLFFYFILIILAPFFAITSVNAQQLQEAGQGSVEVDSSVKIEDVEGISLKLIQGTQDPGSKDVRFDLVIDSTINSDRVQLRWDVTGKSEVVSGAKSQAIQLVAGKRFTTHIVVRPRAFGLSQVRVFVEAYQVDGTRTASASQSFGSYANGEVFPKVEGQDAATLLYYARIVGTVLAIFIGGGLLAYILFRRFLAWYNNRNV